MAITMVVAGRLQRSRLFSGKATTNTNSYANTITNARERAGGTGGTGWGSSSKRDREGEGEGERAREREVRVKQVTSSNFSGALMDSLGALLREAAFVAIDAEMTGLCGTPWRDSFEWDSAAVRFLKLRHSASTFAMLQFGICPFTVSTCSNTLIAHPHTFHLSLSPDQAEGQAEADADFLCQSSSLHFLASHGFDFNTSLRHGIPFLSTPQSQSHSQSLGFHHLIHLLSSHNSNHLNLLLVGHNCILDIAHMYHKFISRIPSTMEHFIKHVHQSFPNLVDTKHLLNAHPTLHHLMKNRSKSLSSAFSSLCPTISHISTPPAHHAHHLLKVQVHTDHHHDGSSWFNSGAKHEAGYDAFMTGCVFAQLCIHLGIKFNPVVPSISDPLHSNVKLKPYLNHLYPTWNSGTVLDFAAGTEKPDNEAYRRKYPKVVFENVVLLWGFPSNLNSKRLKGCIAQVFGSDSVVSVFFIDSSAALVQFKKEEFVKDFLVLKESLERRRKDDPISMLHPFSVIFEGGNTKAGDYNTYRDVIACNLSKVLFKDQADASGVRCKVNLENGEAEKVEREVLEEMKQRAGKVLFLDKNYRGQAL